MTKLVMALAALLVLSPAFADTGLSWLPLGYQQLVLSGGAQSLTIPTGKLPSMVLLEPEVKAVRCRDDGVDPTATVGFLLPVGVSPFQYSGTIGALRCIGTDTTAILNVLYYR